MKEENDDLLSNQQGKEVRKKLRGIIVKMIHSAKFIFKRFGHKCENSTFSRPEDIENEIRKLTIYKYNGYYRLWFHDISGRQLLICVYFLSKIRTPGSVPECTELLFHVFGAPEYKFGYCKIDGNYSSGMLNKYFAKSIYYARLTNNGIEFHLCFDGGQNIKIFSLLGKEVKNGKKQKS